MANNSVTLPLAFTDEMSGKKTLISIYRRSEISMGVNSGCIRNVNMYI